MIDPTVKTDRDVLAQLLDAARNHKITPAEIRAQRRSFARSFSGMDDDQLRRALPELFDADDAEARATQAEAECSALQARVRRLAGALTSILYHTDRTWPVADIAQASVATARATTIARDALTTSSEMHADDLAIASFAQTMSEKMARGREEKGRGGWQSCPVSVLWKMLQEHVVKGDPVDVANLAMMIHHNASSCPPAVKPQLDHAPIAPPPREVELRVRADALLEAADSLTLPAATIRLAVGEMTAFEMRSVQAVLAWRQAVLRDRAAAATGLRASSNSGQTPKPEGETSTV